MTYRSSIFSFDTLRIHRPKGTLFLGCFIALVLIVFAELVARCSIANTDAWAFWNAKSAAKHVLLKERLEDIENLVLVVGDSTADSAFRHSNFKDLIPEDYLAWNIANPGNFPLAFEHSTAPLLREVSPKAVVISLIPTGFYSSDQPDSSEAAILASPYSTRQQKGWHIADSLFLARLWPMLRIRNYDKWRKKVASNHGFSAFTGQGEFKEGSKDFQPPEISTRRLSVLEDFLIECQEMQVAVLVLLPPTADQSKYRVQLDNDFAKVIREMESHFGFAFLDCRDFDFPTLAFYDSNHLNEQGAKILWDAILDNIEFDVVTNEAEFRYRLRGQ